MFSLLHHLFCTPGCVRESSQRWLSSAKVTLTQPHPSTNPPERVAVVGAGGRVWHHILLWKDGGAATAASRLCSLSATLWLHRPQCLSTEIYRSTLTAWDTDVRLSWSSPSCSATMRDGWKFLSACVLITHRSDLFMCNTSLLLPTSLQPF